MRLLKNRFKTVLISGPLIGQRHDPFSAIPSIPIAVPYLASYFEKLGSRVVCIDAFGIAPNSVQPYLSRFTLRGLSAQEIVERIDPEADIIGISVHSGDHHNLAMDVIRQCKERFSAPLIAGGHQATHLYQSFLDSGADFVVLGEGEPAIRGLVSYLRGEKKLEDIHGIAYANSYQPHIKTKELDTYSFPAYHLLPIENYWQLNLAHGPLKRGAKYLPLITSRGCAFGCRFCASSSFWLNKWQPRDLDAVIDEIRYFKAKFDVTNFHIQDPNFAGSQNRVLEFSQKLVQGRLNITWSLPSGIKLDSLSEEAFLAMKDAGFEYFNFSPEHASTSVLRQMGKTVDLEKMIRLVACAEKLGIKKGACFIIGYYGETNKDIMRLKSYLKKLIGAGLDEVSIYIFCPVPGSSDFNNRMLAGMDYYEGLCWSPRWRKDYKKLNRKRVALYLFFLWQKLLRAPVKLLRSILNVYRGNYELKSEMIISRIIHRNS